MTIGFVACAKTKRTHPCEAQDMYQGALFRQSRRYMERLGIPWFILSAKYGLIEPGHIIAPYEVTLLTMTKKERHAWAQPINEKLKQSFAVETTRVIAILSLPYREALAGYVVTYPVDHLGIIAQLGELKKIVGPLPK